MSTQTRYFCDSCGNEVLFEEKTSGPVKIALSFGPNEANPRVFGNSNTDFCKECMKIMQGKYQELIGCIGTEEKKR